MQLSVCDRKYRPSGSVADWPRRSPARPRGNRERNRKLLTLRWREPDLNFGSTRQWPPLRPSNFVYLPETACVLPGGALCGGTEGSNRRLFPIRSSERGSAIEAPITMRRGDLAASCGSTARGGPPALLLLAAALSPPTAVAHRTPQPVLTEVFAYDPAGPSQLLGKWLISGQLDSKLQPLRVGVVEGRIGKMVGRVTVRDGDGLDGANEAMLQARHYICVRASTSARPASLGDGSPPRAASGDNLGTGSQFPPPRRQRPVGYAVDLAAPRHQRRRALRRRPSAPKVRRAVGRPEAGG
jgi:hypothetical protein